MLLKVTRIHNHIILCWYFIIRMPNTLQNYSKNVNSPGIHFTVVDCQTMFAFFLILNGVSTISLCYSTTITSLCYSTTITSLCYSTTITRLCYSTTITRLCYSTTITEEDNILLTYTT